MARYCPHCHRQYDVTLFQFGHEIICPCGALLRDEPPKPESSRKKPVVIRIKMTEERIRRARMRRLQRMADRLCYLIINSDYPRVDLEIDCAFAKAHYTRFWPI